MSTGANAPNFGRTRPAAAKGGTDMVIDTDDPVRGFEGDADGGAAAASTTENSARGSYDHRPAVPPLLRSSCDSCSRKKNKCTGDMPCNRCARAGVQCTYSTKRKLGRPRTAASRNGAGRQGGAGGPGNGGGPNSNKKQRASFTGARRGSGTVNLEGRPSFIVSPATGLAGLAESRFLSCFMEHFNPLYPATDEVSIRDGLVYILTGFLDNGSLQTLRGPESMRGHALSCALFSSIAIGGLVLGVAPADVAHHVDSARQSLSKFRGLADRFAVAALMLFAMSTLLSNNGKKVIDYTACVAEARAIYESLPEKDPLMSAFFSYRAIVDGLGSLTMEEAYSSDPIKALASKSKGVADVGVNTSAGEAIVKHKEAGSSGSPDYVAGGGAGRPDRFIARQGAHPAFTVTDVLYLTVRYPEEEKTAGVWHLHDYIVSEMNRLSQAGAGALVLSHLAGSAIFMKSKLGIADTLSAAKVVAAMMVKAPGSPRHSGGHAVHAALSVFRLHKCRQDFDTVRMSLMRVIDGYVPTYDEFVQGAAICDMEVCNKHCHKILELSTSLSSAEVISRGVSSSKPPSKISEEPTVRGSVDNDEGSLNIHFVPTSDTAIADATTVPAPAAPVPVVLMPAGVRPLGAGLISLLRPQSRSEQEDKSLPSHGQKDLVPPPELLFSRMTEPWAWDMETRAALEVPFDEAVNIAADFEGDSAAWRTPSGRTAADTSTSFMRAFSPCTNAFSLGGSTISCSGRPHAIATPAPSQPGVVKPERDDDKKQPLVVGDEAASGGMVFSDRWQPYLPMEEGLDSTETNSILLESGGETNAVPIQQQSDFPSWNEMGIRVSRSPVPASNAELNRSVGGAVGTGAGEGRASVSLEQKEEHRSGSSSKPCEQRPFRKKPSLRHSLSESLTSTGPNEISTARTGVDVASIPSNVTTRFRSRSVPPRSRSNSPSDEQSSPSTQGKRSSTMGPVDGLGLVMRGKTRDAPWRGRGERSENCDERGFVALSGESSLSKDGFEFTQMSEVHARVEGGFDGLVMDLGQLLGVDDPSALY